MFKKCFLQDVRHNLREISFPDKRKDLFMNNKKLSIRVLFPLIMSISIVFCILSCMILFSHYISTYLVRKTIEETSRQKNVLAQNIENEIDSINSIMNNIYYNTIKKYDIQDKNFKTILANEITSNSETMHLPIPWRMQIIIYWMRSGIRPYMIQMAKTYGTLTI